jgi:hypothetical protein
MRASRPKAWPTQSCSCPVSAHDVCICCRVPLARERVPRAHTPAICIWHSCIKRLVDRLRAIDLADVIGSINAKFNIRIEFFETDASLRTYNRFAIRQLSELSYEGEACWTSFRFTFLNTRDASWKCLQSAFQDFTLA